jgi:hypothetical protein
MMAHGQGLQKPDWKNSHGQIWVIISSKQKIQDAPDLGDSQRNAVM